MRKFFTVRAAVLAATAALMAGAAAHIDGLKRELAAARGRVTQLDQDVVLQRTMADAAREEAGLWRRRAEAAAGGKESGKGVAGGEDAAREARASYAWLVGRWNAAAARLIPVELDPPFRRTSFTWDARHFPHPTFQGGSAKAYTAFASVLATFLESDDNFDQLVRRGLLDVTLAGGGAGDRGWTLRGLITQFSLTNNYSTSDAEICRVIRAYRDRMPQAAAENADVRRRVEELNRKVD